MAGSFTNFAENLILTWVLSASAATRPTTWYIGLLTDTAGSLNDQPSTEATNVNCAGYVRQPVTSWTISGTTPTQAVNNQDAIFTASGAWTAVNYFGVWDALTAGNLIAWGSIPTKTLANTDQLKFAATTGITITLD